MARGYLRWSVLDLSEASGVPTATIKRMEAIDGPPNSRPANVLAVHNALTVAGIVFVPENGGGPGVRLRKIHRKTHRFSKTGAKRGIVSTKKHTTSRRQSLKSNLGQIDSHVIQPEDYDDAPELTAEQLATAVVKPGTRSKRGRR